MNHSSREVRDAMQTLADQLEADEAKISGIEDELEDAMKDIKLLEAQVEDLEEENARLEGVVKHLEQTLAETIMIKGDVNEKVNIVTPSSDPSGLRQNS